MDKLVNCPCCKSDACYQSKAKETIDTWLCMTCGYASNSNMVDGSEFEKSVMTNTAQLILDLKQAHDGLAWYPTVLTIQDKGMIFPEWNKRVQDWYWTVVKSIPIAEEEKTKFPNPEKPGEYYKHRMDMENVKKFDKYSFMDAAEEIGLFYEE